MDTDVKSRRSRRGLAAALLGGCLLALLGSFAVRRAGSPGASRAPERDQLSRALEGAMRGLAEGGGKGAGGEAQDMIGEALSKVRAGAGGGVAGAGAIGAAEGLKGSQASCADGAACAGSAASGEPAAGTESAEGAESEEERLRKVRLEAQERSLERSSAGLGGPASSALAAQSAGRRASGGGSSSALGAEERLAGMFRDFIKKLNAQAAAKGPRADRGGEYGAGGGRQDGGGPTPVVRADKGSPLMASPSFRSLLSAGKDGAHGVSLHQRGMTDGSKDRAGKNFDGHFNTYSPIPIEKAKGAFGQSSIRSRQSQPEYSSPK